MDSTTCCEHLESSNRGHSGGPWGQHDGLEVVNNMVFVDFGMILGLVNVSFWDFIILTNSFCFRVCFQVIFLSTSASKIRRLGFSNQGFRIEGIAKIDLSWKSFFMNV